MFAPLWSSFKIDEDNLYGLLRTVPCTEGHLSIANILHNRALNSWNDEEFGTAARLFRESIAMKPKILGPKEDDESISLALYSLAAVMNDENLLMESEVLYREALQIDRRIFSASKD